MTIRPLRNQVVVKLDDKESISSGGLHLIHATQNDATRKGVVIAAGPGVQNQDGSFSRNLVEKGEKVIIPGYPLTPIEIEGIGEVVFVLDNNILGVYLD